MSRFAMLEKAKRDALGEANRHHCPYMIVDVLGEFWVRKYDKHKLQNILERYPNAEYCGKVYPLPDLFDGEGSA